MAHASGQPPAVETETARANTLFLGKVIVAGWCIALFLFVADVGTYLAQPQFQTLGILRPWFNLGGEGNIPAGFSTLLLLMNAFLLAKIACSSRGISRKYWWVLGCGFLIMGADEWFALHERLVQPTAALLNFLGLRTGHLGPLAFAWVAPAMVLLACLAWVFFPFIAAMPRLLRRRCLLAATVYITGAVGLEMAGGWWFESNGNVFDPVYVMLAQLEELLEMCGMLLFAGALADVLRYPAVFRVACPCDQMTPAD